MRNFRKLLAVIVVIALVMTSMTIPAFAADSFANEDKAQTLYDLGLYAGTSETEFVPDLGGTLTREMGVVLVLKLFGLLADADAVAAEDAAKTLTDKFSDAANISDWAKTRVAYAVENEIISGRTDGTFDPQGALKGKDFATMILKKLGYTPKYQTAAAQLATVGGLSAEEALMFNDKALVRDDAVGVAYGSLSARYEADGKTIVEVLAESDDAFMTKAIDAGLIEAPATITALATLDDVKADVGATVTLPATILATYSDGSTADVAVTWGTVDTTAAGTKAIEGTVAGTDLKAKVNVVVAVPALAVTAVSASNSTKVVATFNRAKADTDTYAPVVKQGTTTFVVDSVTYSTDKKSATIVLHTALIEGKFTVDAIEGSYLLTAPKLTKAEAKDATHILLTFDKELKKDGAELVNNYTIVKVANNTTSNLVIGQSSAKLLVDKKTVLITLAGADLNAGALTAFGLTGDNYIAYVDQSNATKVVSSDDVAVKTNDNATFAGTTAVDSTPPSIVRAYYSSATKKLVFDFDEPINLNVSLFKTTQITATAGTTSYTLTTSDTASINGSTVSIQLTTASAAQLATIAATTGAKVSFLYATIQDLLENKNAAFDADLTANQAPSLTAAAYEEATQKLTLTFDTAIDITKITSLAGVSIQGTGAAVQLGSVQADKLLSTANGTSLVIRLGVANARGFAGGAAEAAPAAPKISIAEGTFRSTGDVGSMLASNVAIVFTADATAPTVVSATLDRFKGELTVVYSEPIGTPGTVSITDSSAAPVTVASGAPIGDVEKQSALTNPTVVYPFTAAQLATLVTQPLRLVVAAATILDVPGNALAELKVANNVQIADSSTAQPRVNAAAVLHKKMMSVTFSVNMDRTSVENISNYSVMNGVNRLLVNKAELSSDKKTVFLTTDAQTNAASYRITVSGVKSETGYSLDSNFTYSDVVGVATNGTVDVVPNANQQLYFVDTDGSNTVTAGDTFTVRLNQPALITNTATVFDAATMLKLVNATVTRGTYSNDLLVTCGSGTLQTIINSNIGLGTGVTTTEAGANGVAVVTVLPPTNQVVGPKVTAAVFADVNADGLANANDTLTLTFDQELNMTASMVDAATLAGIVADLSLAKADGTIVNPAATFNLAITKATWDSTSATTRKNIVLTLNNGTDLDQYANAVQGPLRDAYINGKAACTTIRNIWGVGATASASFVKITTSATAQTLAPKIIAATYYDVGAAGVSANDFIKIKFDRPVSGGAIAGLSATTAAGGARAIAGGATLVQTAADEYAVVYTALSGTDPVPGDKIDVVFGANTFVDVSSTRAAPVGGVTIASSNTVADAQAPYVTGAALYSAYEVFGRWSAYLTADFANVGGSTLTVSGTVNGTAVSNTRALAAAPTDAQIGQAIQEILGLPAGTVTATNGGVISVYAPGYTVKSLALASSTTPATTVKYAAGNWTPIYVVRVTMNEAIRNTAAITVAPGGTTFGVLGTTFVAENVAVVPQTYNTQYDVKVYALPATSAVTTAAIGTLAATVTDLSGNNSALQNAGSVPVWIALPAAP